MNIESINQSIGANNQEQEIDNLSLLHADISKLKKEIESDMVSGLNVSAKEKVLLSLNTEYQSLLTKKREEVSRLGDERYLVTKDDTWAGYEGGKTKPDVGQSEEGPTFRRSL